MNAQRIQLVCSLLVAVVIAVVVILLVSARVPVGDDDDSGRGRGRGRGGDDDESLVVPRTAPVRLDFDVTWRARRTLTSPTR